MKPYNRTSEIFVPDGKPLKEVLAWTLTRMTWKLWPMMESSNVSAAALLGVYDSQISGGKRYDTGTMGRRRANATYFTSHGVDTTTYLIYAMDLAPLIKDPKLSFKVYIRGYIERFCDDVLERTGKLGDVPQRDTLPIRVRDLPNELRETLKKALDK